MCYNGSTVTNLATKEFLKVASDKLQIKKDKVDFYGIVHVSNVIIMRLHKIRRYPKNKFYESNFCGKKSFLNKLPWNFL